MLISLYSIFEYLTQQQRVPCKKIQFKQHFATSFRCLTKKNYNFSKREHFFRILDHVYSMVAIEQTWQSGGWPWVGFTQWHIIYQRQLRNSNTHKRFRAILCLCLHKKWTKIKTCNDKGLQYMYGWMLQYFLMKTWKTLSLDALHTSSLHHERHFS